MEFSEQVLVLQVGKFKEADLWVRFLSPTRGLLSAFAFGGSRSRKRFVGCLDTFNEVNIRVSPTGRGAYLALQEGVLVKGLCRLRTDWARFGLANNCTKFLQAFGVGPEGAEKAHFLVDQTLCLLEEADSLPPLLPLFFRARLAFDQGYAMDAGQCALCGNTLHSHGAYLLLRDGQLVCPVCAPMQAGQRLFLGPEALETLETVHALEPLQWASILLSARAKNECARAIDGFIQYHVGLAWENGRFTRV